MSPLVGCWVALLVFALSKVVNAVTEDARMLRCLLLQEKLSPVLAMYRAKDFEDAMNKSEKLLNFAGPGHTAVHYTNPVDT